MLSTLVSYASHKSNPHDHKILESYMLIFKMFYPLKMIKVYGICSQTCLCSNLQILMNITFKKYLLRNNCSLTNVV